MKCATISVTSRSALVEFHLEVYHKTLAKGVRARVREIFELGAKVTVEWITN